jgi:nitric oxide reductase subunit B
MPIEEEIMVDQNTPSGQLSPWWRNSVIIVLVIGFAVLIWMAIRAHKDAPPIPEKVVGPSGETIFTREEILAGQEVFLKYGLMENGTIWGHGAYLGPDFSAEYLHALAIDARNHLAKQYYQREWPNLSPAERAAIGGEIQQLLKQNRYNQQTHTLDFTPSEVMSYRSQIGKWTEYFSQPALNRGLLINQVKDPKELQQLTAFFAWTAWASAANRPGRTFSYTNNFPYDPMVGNTPSGDAILWSALSLITLLAGIAIVLFSFGKFNFLGWKSGGGHIHPQMSPGMAFDSQKATIKYFVVVALLFFVQALAGGATAHYRADPGSFYGIDLSSFFPGNIFRTWHLQLAIFWIATG